MPDSYVLDSFALLALIRGEPGRPKVEELLRRAEEGEVRLLLCIVNYGEILYSLERTQDAEAIRDAIAGIDDAPVEVVDADRKLTFSAAHIKARHPMSYADAFAVALAMRESATVVTGDPEFKSVQELVKIEWIPPTGIEI